MLCNTPRTTFDWLETAVIRGDFTFVFIHVQELHVLALIPANRKLCAACCRPLFGLPGIHVIPGKKHVVPGCNNVEHTQLLPGIAAQTHGFGE